MSDGWIPEPYFDEVVAEPKASPSDWIGALDDGAPALLDFDGEVPERALQDGQQMGFYETRGHGGATLKIADDGTWSVDRPLPVGANHIYCPDNEMSGSSVDALLKEAKEAFEGHDSGGFEPGGEYWITYWYWSDLTPFRFDAATRSFVQVAS